MKLFRFLLLFLFSKITAFCVVEFFFFSILTKIKIIFDLILDKIICLLEHAMKI